MLRFLIALLFGCNCLFAQTYPKFYFAPPLNIPLALAGNYGEIRLNHFHYGLDFRTNNKEGYPVLSSADGFISRVKISGYGYGKVIYIDHPNGYTTVYGHLSQLTGPIASYVKKQQLANQKFDFEYYPKPEEFPVVKGQQIGFSGNTGSSQGPHLHYEIRETKCEDPLNPQLFGFPIMDKICPTLEMISVYQVRSLPEYSKRKDHKYRLAETTLKDTLLLPDTAGIGYSGFDQETIKGSRNGLYEVTMILDKDTVYQSRIDRMSFEQSRYVNAHIDYEEKVKGGKAIEKTFLSGNNKAPIYLRLKERGLIILKDSLIHKGKFILKDINGNTSEYQFRYRRKKSSGTEPLKLKGERFYHNKTNIYNKEGILVDIPANALYDDIDFTVKRKPAFKGGYSSVYSVHNTETALQSAMIISIKNNPVDEKLKDKLVMVSVGDNGRLRYAGSDWVNGMLTAESKSFGSFAVYLDTVAPFARHIGFKRGAKLKNMNSIQVKAYDNISDVKTYNGYIDGKWKLFEFDAKSDLFTYRFEESPSGKTHELKFECTDERGNKTVITVPFVR